MKNYILLLVSIFTITSCSVSSPLTVTSDSGSGLKQIRLRQSPAAQSRAGDNDLPVGSFKNLSFIYLFEEKPAARPEITLSIQSAHEGSGGKMDSATFIQLEDEMIRLFSVDSLQRQSSIPAVVASHKQTNRRFLIPENLWVSILHSKEISYHLILDEMKLSVNLNTAEKVQLAEFLQRCIRQRDKKFPAVPEGQVKW